MTAKRVSAFKRRCVHSAVRCAGVARDRSRRRAEECTLPDERRPVPFRRGRRGSESLRPRSASSSVKTGSRRLIRRSPAGQVRAYAGRRGGGAKAPPPANGAPSPTICQRLASAGALGAPRGARDRDVDGRFFARAQALLVAAPIWPQASTNFFVNSGIDRVVAAARAIRSRSHRGGTRCCWCRNTSRKRRLARLRCTAPPTAFLEAMTQTRGWSVFGAASGVGLEAAIGISRGFHQTVNVRHSIRRPFSRAARMSLWRRRCCSGRKRMLEKGLKAER